MCLGIPGEILEIWGEDPLSMRARVSFGGAVREVCMAGVPDAQVGEFVIVHAGFALNRLDQAEAREVNGYLERILASHSPEIRDN